MSYSTHYTPRRISSWDPEFLRFVIAQAYTDLIDRLSTSSYWLNLDHAALKDCKFAYEVLDRGRQAVEVEIRGELPRYSAFAWLILLRELPDECFGWAGSTSHSIVTIRDLCEYFTAEAPDRSNELDSQYPELVPKPDINGVCALARVVAGAQVLKRLHAKLRAAAKGVAFHGSDVFPPDPDSTPSQKSAIELYDKRISQPSTGTLFYSGVDLMAPGSVLDEPAGAASILSVSRKVPSELIRLPFPPGGQSRAAFSLAAPSLSPLTAFNKSVGECDWYGTHGPTLALVLRLGLLLILDQPGSEWCVIEKGVLYFRSRRQLKEAAGKWYGLAHDAVEEVFGPNRLSPDLETALDSLESLQPSPWPMRPGAVLRAERSVVALDLHAASHSLILELAMPVYSGEFANVRARIFEEAVQTVIDGSPWGNLPPEVRNLRGLQLKDANGALITDLDAIGCRGRTLLLVDCLSSVPRSDANNIGDYKAYRNAASTVEDKVAGDLKGQRPSWLHKINQVVGKRGTNFDLTSYDSTVGVVVTPSPIYVEQSILRRPTVVSMSETAPGLLSASTLAELREWLHRPIA